MKTRLIACSVLTLALAGCGPDAGDNSPTAANAATNASADRTVATVPPCPLGSATLPVTGLCEAQASALLLAAQGPQPAAPDDCSWTVNEAQLPGGGAVLYRAAQCNGRTAKLDHAAGTPMGKFMLTVSPYGGSEAEDAMVQMAPAVDAAAILAIARAAVTDPAERARCQMRAVATEGRPSDALVVDEVPIPPSDEIRGACGPYGLDEGSQTFWRLSQGHGWFFQLGQETPVVDAGSFTLVRRDAAGNWVRS